MMRFGLKASGIACVVVVSLMLCWHPAAWGYYLDSDSTIKFGLRSYVNARIGTQGMSKVYVRPSAEDIASGFPSTGIKMKSESFPRSPAGHMRQNRFFLEAELEHNVTKLMQKGFGPLAMLNTLPFKVNSLKYHLVYRGEADGIYNWGPSEFRGTGGGWSTLYEDNPFDTNTIPPATCTLGRCPNIAAGRHKLRQQATDQHRLYQAFIDLTVGNLFVRAGRQILVWGETDAFRLIDNINPIDSSFGGFLIALDERRVPLDMIRASYYIGQVGDAVSEMTLEGYAAIDSKVSFYPGTPEGSPWTLPNGGATSGDTRSFKHDVSRKLGNTRGGARLLFNAFDVTWSVAHYYTYADLPLVQTCVHPGQGFNGFPFRNITSRRSYLRTDASGQRIVNNPDAIDSIPGCPEPVPDVPFEQERPACTGSPNDPPNCRQLGEYDTGLTAAFAIQSPARIQVSGATATFTVPAFLSRRLALSGEPVIRTELAYIKDEPGFTERQLDPFVYHSVNDPDPLATGGTLRRDSINFVVGIDSNQFIRFLNARNSFFITTQFFYKHIKGAEDDEILPVTREKITPRNPFDPVDPTNPDKALRGLGAIEPIFVSQYRDQFLQTLLISTSYRSGTINPSFTFFYDWSGSLVYIPSVTFVHDPFRFTMQYNAIDSGFLRGNSGTSLLRDRDNLLFQLEYVI